MRYCILFSLAVLLLTGCQNLHTPTPVILPASVSASDINRFNITGKIGITTISDNTKQAGSAFYAWGQDDKRFAIDLTGALGIGATHIRYDGKTATLHNEQGQISADNADELLTKATGWHAPISQLPYWVLGKSAPSDSDTQLDNGRLHQATNQNWTARFEYANDDNRPNRLVITHTDGHRVVMTINHSPK